MFKSCNLINVSDHFCLKKGFALPGGVIKSVAFTTVQACKEECAKTEGCVAFTTQAGTYNKCNLKNKSHAAESAFLTAISARMSCYKDDYCLKRGQALSGEDLKSLVFTTVEACKEECAKTEGCVAFTTQAGTWNKCFLKNQSYDEDLAGENYISALMNWGGGQRHLGLFKAI